MGGSAGQHLSTQSSTERLYTVSRHKNVSTRQLLYLITCLEVMQDIFKTGSAAESHDNGVAVPSN